MKSRLLLAFFIMTSCFVLQAGHAYDTLYTKNIISFQPAQYYVPHYLGVGLSYERLLNRNIGIRIPLMTALNNQYFAAAIQLKLYPLPADQNVAYSIAPTFYYGSGTYQDLFSSSSEKRRQLQVGFLINQSLDFVIQHHLYLDMEMGLGINYLDLRKPDPNRITAAFQGQLGMGYRF